MHYACLLVILVISVYTVIRDKNEYKAFKKVKSPKKRLMFYKGWLRKSYVLIGLPAVVVLLLLQKTNYIFQPIWSNDTTKLAQAEIHNHSAGSTALGVIFGLFLAVAGFGVITYLRSRWSQNVSTVTVGDVQALLPRNAKERWYGLWLSIAAGMNEELLFRVAVPVILLGILPDPKMAIAISIVGFGLMHIYQGVSGVLGATFAGAGLMYMYLITGNVFTSMLLHAFIDTNSIVLQPLIARYAVKNSLFI
jgi:membrane protease YdiL (CAAX protease family)